MTNLSFLRSVEQQHVANHHWPFFGCFMQQPPQAVMSLNRLLLAHDFSTIIEVGTHDGGTSTLFALYAYGSTQPAQAADPREPSLYKNNTHHKRPKRFVTVDNVLRDIPRLQLLQQLGTAFIHGDCLDDAAIVGQIRGLIQLPGTTLLLCDGGNKRREVELYAPWLKHGDFIMVHDWAMDAAAAKSLRDRGIWDSHESWWGTDGPTDAVPRDGIQRACETNGVVQVYAEEFDDTAWFCGRKAM